MNCPRKSRHIGMKQNGTDNTIRIELFLAQMFNEEDERKHFFFTTGRRTTMNIPPWSLEPVQWPRLEEEGTKWSR